MAAPFTSSPLAQVAQVVRVRKIAGLAGSFASLSFIFRARRRRDDVFDDEASKLLVL